jgi:glycosyltransferase involved in cell wall biosynthesis
MDTASVNLRPAPRLTVVIATYQAEAYIARCLDSVRAQRFQEYEVWVIDGGSRDRTVEIVRERAAVDARIQCVSERDRGVYDAMNKGVARARGAWIFFLGADDRFAHPDALSDLAPHLDESTVDFVHADIVWRNDGWGRDGTVYGGEIAKAELLEKNFCHQGVFYARSLFERHGGYHLDYRVLADWEFNIRVFDHARRRYVKLLVAEVFGGGLSQSAHDYAFDRDFVRNASSALGLQPKSAAFRNRNNKIKQTFKAHFRARRFRAGWRYLRIWLSDEDPAVFRAILLGRFRRRAA